MSTDPRFWKTMTVLAVLLAAITLLVQRQAEPAADILRRADLVRVEQEVARLHADVLRAERERAKVREELGAIRRSVRDGRQEPDELEPGERHSSIGGGRVATGGSKAEVVQELGSLHEKIYSEAATPEEESRYWELFRTSAVADDFLAELERRVADEPGNTEFRMDLGRGYVAKLLSIPAGPEQGLWSGKAEAQWRAVLERDPDHWDARYSLAFNWSQYPEFLGKSPDAIEQFEKLRTIQERGAPTPRQVQTYLQLSILYRRQGKVEAAREVLISGRLRHPDDREIEKALRAME